MMYSSILSDLPQRPVAEILRDLGAVRTARKHAAMREASYREQREQLELEEATLVQLVALARLGEQEDPDQESLELSSDDQDAAKENLARHVFGGLGLGVGGSKLPAAAASGNGGGRPRSTRSAILQLMRGHPEHERWTTKEVKGRLALQGIRASTNLIGVTMRRMVESGELVRDENDSRFFKLPPARETTSMGARGDSKP